MGLEQCLSDPHVLQLVGGGDLAGTVVEDSIFGGSKNVSQTVVKTLSDTLPTMHLGDSTQYMEVQYKRGNERGTIKLS